MATSSLDLNAAIQHLKQYKSQAADLQREIWAKVLELALRMNYTMKIPSAKEQPHFYRKLVNKGKASPEAEYYKEAITIPMIGKSQIGTPFHFHLCNERFVLQTKIRNMHLVIYLTPLFVSIC